MRIEFRVSGQKVISPDDGCVTSNVAAANITFLQYCNALEPIFFCQVGLKRHVVQNVASYGLVNLVVVLSYKAP